MSDEFSLPPEAEAFEAFLSWLNDGKRVWTLFEEKGLSVPESLRRALDAGGSGAPRRARVSPPSRPEQPAAAKSDWLWIPAQDAMVRTVVLALLNEGKPIPSKQLIVRVKQILPATNHGSVFNIGTQLTNRILKSDLGWTLKPGEKAPCLHKNYIWGAADVLQNQDLAAFRRMAVRHLLEISSDGLQVMQIYKQLKEGAGAWLRTPLSKDLIKADIELMNGKGEIRQLGHSKKWTLKGRE